MAQSLLRSGPSLFTDGPKLLEAVAFTVPFAPGPSAQFPPKWKKIRKAEFKMEGSQLYDVLGKAKLDTVKRSVVAKSWGEGGTDRWSTEDV